MAHTLKLHFLVIQWIVILCLPSTVFAGRIENNMHIRVGAISPQTGPFASGGNAFMRSLEVVLDEINGNEGIGGVRVELVKGDSEGNVAAARREAIRLIEKEQVDYIVGAYLSEETMGVIEVAAKARKLLLIPISAAGQITEMIMKNPERYKTIFRTGYSIRRWALLLSKFISSKNYSQYAFIGSQIRWNRELGEQLKSTLQSKGIEEVFSGYYSPGNPVIKPVVMKALATKPRILVLGDPGKNSIEVIKALSSAGYEGPLISVGGTLADGRVVGELSPTFPLFALASCYRGSSKDATDYFESYRKKFGHYPSGYSDTLPGDALRILVEALSRSKDLGPESLAGMIENGEFRGAAGLYRFDKSHQALWGESRDLPGAIITWSNGAFELIFP